MTGRRTRTLPILVAAMAALTLTSAVGASAHSGARSIKPGVPGQFNAVAAVPKSSRLFVVAQTPGDSPFAQERTGGKWKNLGLPSVVRNPGELHAVAAPSKSSVWAAGYDTNFGGWLGRLKGHRFVTVKLPGLSSEGAWMSMSATSPTNIWLAGAAEASFPSIGNRLAVEHWNGKTWTATPLPANTEQVAIASSSSKNAWTTDGSKLYHWNGKVWAVGGKVPSSVKLVGLAMHGKHGVAVGSSRGAPHGLVVYQTYVMRLTGKTWKHVATPHYKSGGQLSAATISGKFTWVVGYREEDQASFSGVYPLILESSGGKFKAQRLRFGPDLEGGWLRGITALSPKQVTAVGLKGYDFDYESAVASYNGKSWQSESAK